MRTTARAARWTGEHRLEVGEVQMPPPGPGAVLVERDGVLKAWMDKRSCDAIVVRPDNIVFGVALGSKALAGLLARVNNALR